LFEGSRDRIPLALTDSKVFSNRVVKLVYRPAND
jgi:hypothetical protein